MVGELEWKSYAKMNWENNVAKGNARQVNGPMSEEAFQSFFS